MRTLVTPPAAQRDPNAVQMLSAWIAEKDLHCTLNIGMWSADGVDESKAWGMLLADVIRHVGNALREQTGASAVACVEAVARALNEELGEPTSDTKGGFHAGNH